jgi:hypothetical protein
MRPWGRAAGANRFNGRSARDVAEAAHSKTVTDSSDTRKRDDASRS